MAGKRFLNKVFDVIRSSLRFDLEEDSTDREALADSKLEVQSEEMEVAKPTAVVY